MTGTCKNSNDLDTAIREFTANKHPNLNYDNYKKVTEGNTRTASTG